MKPDTERAPLSHPLRVDDIKDGAGGEIVASRCEQDAIARLLDLVALDRLVFNYRLDRAGGGRLRLTGRLEADVTQTCVVSLDPVAAHLDLPVELAFWPAAMIEDLERKAEEPGHHEIQDWPEPIIDGKIDLGPLIYETLATGLEPYPKREGASFDWSQSAPQEAETPESSPFAALAALKRP
jgi:uncharacterized metal-binding protein YceD (DUF177 family)